MGTALNSTHSSSQGRTTPSARVSAPKFWFDDLVLAIDSLSRYPVMIKIDVN
jgi:hypothetical protein